MTKRRRAVKFDEGERGGLKGMERKRCFDPNLPAISFNGPRKTAPPWAKLRTTNFLAMNKGNTHR